MGLPDQVTWPASLLEGAQGGSAGLPQLVEALGETANIGIAAAVELVGVPLQVVELPFVGFSRARCRRLSPLASPPTQLRVFHQQPRTPARPVPRGQGGRASSAHRGRVGRPGRGQRCPMLSASGRPATPSAALHGGETPGRRTTNGIPADSSYGCCLPESPKSRCSPMRNPSSETKRIQACAGRPWSTRPGSFRSGRRGPGAPPPALHHPTHRCPVQFIGRSRSQEGLSLTSALLKAGGAQRTSSKSCRACGSAVREAWRGRGVHHEPRSGVR